MNCKQCNAEYEEEYGYDGFCSESCQSDYDISHASDYRNALEKISIISGDNYGTRYKRMIQKLYLISEIAINALPSAEGKED